MGEQSPRLQCDHGNQGCSPLCQTEWSHFPIKPGQPVGMALTMFSPFPNSLIRAKNRFVKNGTVNFGRNIPTEISGPPPEVIPNIPVRRNRNGPFHLNSDRNF